jgi:hypothetical protein
LVDFFQVFSPLNVVSKINYFVRPHKHFILMWISLQLHDRKRMSVQKEQRGNEMSEWEECMRIDFPASDKDQRQTNHSFVFIHLPTPITRKNARALQHTHTHTHTHRWDGVCHLLIGCSIIQSLITNSAVSEKGLLASTPYCGIFAQSKNCEARETAIFSERFWNNICL